MRSVHWTKCLDLQTQEANPEKDATACSGSTEYSSPLSAGERIDFSLILGVNDLSPISE